MEIVYIMLLFLIILFEVMNYKLINDLEDHLLDIERSYRSLPKMIVKYFRKAKK